MNLTELLTKQQEKHAISLTHDAANIDNDDIDDDAITSNFSSEWEEKRNAFIAKFPIAQKMFSENNEDGPYRLRYKNIQLSSVAEPDPDVFEFLSQYISDVSPADYKIGILTFNKQNVKIGKLLQKFKASQYIINAYAKDPYRNITNSDIIGTYDIVITGHPIDVYGMSTGRKWTSCANMMKKHIENNASHMDAAANIAADINNHTHLAYLIKAGGDIHTDAIARRSYKLMVDTTDSTKSTLLPDSTRVYRSYTDDAVVHSFREIADKLMNKLFKVETGLWSILDNLYNDSESNEFLTDLDGNIFNLSTMNKKQVSEFFETAEEHVIRYIVDNQSNRWDSSERTVMTMFCKSQDDFLNIIVPHNLDFIFETAYSDFSDLKVSDYQQQPFPKRYAEYLHISNICRYTSILVKAITRQYNKTPLQVVCEYVDKHNYTKEKISELFALNLHNIFDKIPEHSYIRMDHIGVKRDVIIVYMRSKEPQKEQSVASIIKHAIVTNNKAILHKYEENPLIPLDDILMLITDDTTSEWILNQKKILDIFFALPPRVLQNYKLIFKILKPKLLPALEKFKLQNAIDNLYTT